MKKYKTIPAAVFAVLLLCALVFGVYYRTMVAPWLNITYNTTPYMIHLFLMAPLFYWALAALAGELLRCAGGLTLSGGVQKACLIVGGVLTAVWLVYALLIALRVPVPMAFGYFIIDWPQAFLIPGLALGLGLHRERKGA